MIWKVPKLGGSSRALGGSFQCDVHEIHEGLNECLKLRNEVGAPMHFGEPFNVKLDEIHEGLDDGLKLRNDVVAPGHFGGTFQCQKI